MDQCGLHALCLLKEGRRSSSAKRVWSENERIQTELVAKEIDLRNEADEPEYNRLFVPPCDLRIPISSFKVSRTKGLDMNVALNKSSQEPPFRKPCANLSPAFAVP